MPWFAYRLSVANCGRGSLSKRVVYEVTERTKLVVGPGSAATRKILFQDCGGRDAFS